MQKFFGAATLLMMAGAVQAVPTLQLDIGGGSYVWGSEESVVTEDSAFTLYAYATPGNVTPDYILGQTYYLSVALLPTTEAAGDYGSFDFDFLGDAAGAMHVNVSSDMAYGTPPFDAVADSASLAKHDVYKTWYKEYAFQFDAALLADVYNTQDNAGAGATPGCAPAGLTSSPVACMFYQGFDFDIGNLADGYDLHFDLYSTKVREKKGDMLTLVDDFAPFSHDARTNVPEPGALVLLGGALLMLGGGIALRRRRAGLAA